MYDPLVILNLQIRFGSRNDKSVNARPQYNSLWAAEGRDIFEGTPLGNLGRQNARTGTFGFP